MSNQNIRGFSSSFGVWGINLLLLVGMLLLVAGYAVVAVPASGI